MNAHLVEITSFGRGGIHPPTHKDLTSHLAIEDLPWPGEVWLPLVQHLGDPAVPIVKKGDTVARGQMIAEGGETGVPIHASVPGRIKFIDKRPHPTLVSCPTLVIRHTDETDELPLEEDPDWRALGAAETLDRIRQAGIVGLGGAAFPTYRKLVLPPGVAVDTFIVNGAECEPYLTADHRLMKLRPREILEGALIMTRLVGARRLLIGIEADKRDVIRGFRDAAADTPMQGIEFDVRVCEVRYPQGAERQLITSLTGRVVPARALPSAVGVIVQNVATSEAVYEAVRFRRPLIDRIMTVTGPGVAHPRNLRVPLGTLLQDIVAFCGGAREDTTRLIAGGPMMGRALPRLDLPLIKGMNGLVLLTGRGPFEEGYGPCIQCGRCLDACPLGLEPNQVSIFVEAGRTLETDPFGTLDCYECGSCTYVCPSERPLLQFMQVAKSALRRAKDLRIAR